MMWLLHLEGEEAKPKNTKLSCTDGEGVVSDNAKSICRTRKGRWGDCLVLRERRLDGHHVKLLQVASPFLA